MAEHILAKRDEVDGPIRLNVLVGRCREWPVPGVLLLGDAAHPVSPVRAQGIKVALRDAVVAANHLVPVLRKGAEPSAVDAACRAVQAEREPGISVPRSFSCERHVDRATPTPGAGASGLLSVEPIYLGATAGPKTLG